MNTTPVVDPSSLAVRVRVSSAEEATESQLRRLPSGQDGVRGTRLFQRMCLLVLLIVVSAASFSAFYQKWHFREQGARGTDLIAEFDRMIDGTAHRPYIYRQMFPDIANALTRVLPVDAISRRVPQRAKDRISVAFNLTSKAYPAQYLIFYIATYLFALFAAAALYKVCTAASFAEPVAVFAAVVFMLLFPLFGVKGGYFCDYPELFFMAVAVWMALKLDWWWIIPVAALGTWNKESFLLFMFTLYPLFRRGHSRLNSLIGVGVLVAACIAVYLPIRQHFAHNAGGTVEWHLRDQIDFYVHPFKMDTWVDRTYDLMFPALSAPIPTLMLIWTVWRGWRFLPVWLRRHAQIAAAINIPLFLLFCQPGEFRDLSMLYVSFLFILAFNLQEWMNPANLQRAASNA